MINLEEEEFVEARLLGERPASFFLMYKGGWVSVLPGGFCELEQLGLVPYPNEFLTIGHAVTLTRVLASFHAASRSLILTKSGKLSQNQNPLPSLKASLSNNKCNERDFEDLDMEDSNSVSDEWTMEVCRLSLARANLSILCDHLKQTDHDPQTVTRLEGLQDDLPTVVQFLQFSSKIQSRKVQSVGPIAITDIWIEKEEGEEEVMAIRLCGGPSLFVSPLRDTAWCLLTLLRPDILRDRYQELCDSYCQSFNKALQQQRIASESEELSYFDVIKDLGENFLHAFLTVVHKFVMSNKWYFDRQLHTSLGVHNMAETISFLVDNGIVDSIFIL